MSPRQYQKYLGKLGFTDLRLSEDWMVVRDEVDQLLKQNGLSRFNEVTKKQVWESPNFLDVKSSTKYCIETIAEKRIFVFAGISEKCPAVYHARIDATKLASIVESRKLYITLYCYLPGRAILIYAYESKYYDRVSPICAKVFKGRVKSQLLDESADLE
jgi:hypothetical protein